MQGESTDVYQFHNTFIETKWIKLNNSASSSRWQPTGVSITIGDKSEFKDCHYSV